MKSTLIERKVLIPLLGALMVFVISRGIYDQVGIQFQGDTYLGYWQFIDPVLLRTDLWRSVFYLHSQPPLMNLLTGIVLQVFPESSDRVFHIIYCFIGFILAISLYQLCLQMGFHPWLSGLLSTWFMINPATILYEHWLTYNYPIAAALTLAGVCLFHFLGTKNKTTGFAFFCLLAFVALMWSLFHIVWLIPIALVIYKFQDRPGKWAGVVFIPLLFVAGWYTKNLVIFGEFTASSWVGMNFSKIATFRIPEDERKQLVNSGEISALALILPFRNPHVYLEYFPDTPLMGVPVLDEPEISTGGRNHHNLVYIKASNRYLKDAIQLVVLKPQYYVRSVSQALYIYFHSASDFDLVSGNRSVIHSLDLWWNRIFYGQLMNDETSIDRNAGASPKNFGWTLLLVFILSMLGTFFHLWIERGELGKPQNLLAAFMLYNILFVTMTGNLMDIGENNRFRYVIDPFLLILFIFFLRKVIIKFWIPKPIDLLE